MKREDFYNIRKSRNQRYENLFFVGDWSRNIICQVTCPDHLPDKKEDLVYFRNVYEALEAGLQLCPICRPDLFSEQIILNQSLSNEVNNAVTMINEGYLSNHTVQEMADRLFVSERHLRRMFNAEIGISPTKLATYQKLFFARSMLEHQNMTIADIALASGFSSVRQFNYMYRKMFHTVPGNAKKDRALVKGDDNVLYASYYDGFDFSWAMNCLRKTAVPDIDSFNEAAYTRTFDIDGALGIFTVEDEANEHKLRITISAEDKSCYMAVYHRVQHMFGLLDKKHDSILGFDTFETGIRCILEKYEESGDKVRGLQQQIVRTCGSVFIGAAGETLRSYPDARHMPDHKIAEIIKNDRCHEMICEFCNALINNRISLAFNQTQEHFIDDMMSIKGMDENTAGKIARSGLRIYDDRINEVRAALNDMR